MARFCPITQETVIYLECLECDDKRCRNMGTPNSQPFHEASYATPKERKNYPGKD